jgi:O-antigen/teichoic acid export membrane protein
MSGVILVPVFTRMLTPTDYGAQDILVQLAIFIAFLINLELYNGVGRIFYEKETLREKRSLVSTGLMTTLIINSLVILMITFFGKHIYDLFFDTGEYLTAFKLAMVWASISSIYTYLLVIMRYMKKPRIYLLFVGVQLIIRLVVSIILVAVVKLNVQGVILGHIACELASILMFGVYLRKYLTVAFERHDSRKILSFSLPLVPAVLIISFEKPLMRYLVAHYLPISDLGLFSAAFQIAALLGIMQYGLRLAWYPHLFEIVDKKDFNKEIQGIFSIVLDSIACLAFLLIFNSSLVMRLLTAPAYYAGRGMIGVLVVKFVIDIVRQIVGCGPAITKQTKYNMIFEFIGTAASLIFFLLLHKQIGIYGLVAAMLGGALIKFAGGWGLTTKLTAIRFDVGRPILIIIALLIVSILYAMYEPSILLSLLGSAFVMFLFMIRHGSRMLNYLKQSHLAKLLAVRS